MSYCMECKAHIGEPHYDSCSCMGIVGVGSIKSKPDVVNHPSHYTAGKVECIDALEAATEGLEGIEAVCTANAIKYLWRWKKKNGHEDLRKARWYINKLLGDTP